MRKSTILKTMVVAAVLLVWVSAAMPACTDNDYVPDTLRYGESKCIRVCRNQAYPAIQLLGRRYGAQNVPILSLTPGCNASNSNCDFTCTAITPPPWPWPFGGPFGEQVYFGENNCFWMFLWYDSSHNDNTWWLEIYTMNYAACAGCFCLSFDDQLPVELSSPLAATPGDNEVTLRWATASEAENDHFEIQRDGTQMGTVAGLGTSSTGRSYSWKDNNAQNGSTYTYTLESVDLNGNRHALGNVTATPLEHSPAAVTEFQLYQNYPNPFNPTTSIAFDLPASANVTLKVFNPMGSEVTTLANREYGAGHHNVDFNGNNLTSGLYFYSIQTDDGFSATRKMLLIK